MLLKGVAVIAVLPVALAAVAADKVDALPGFVGELPSTHYSGYLPTGKETGAPGQLHYWLIESENDPKNDPIVLWLNGGPGSSSLIGLLTENGQIQLNDDSLNTTGTPRPFYNKHGWTQKANVLWLESPKGVGFSYCESTPCRNTDESTAIDAHEFLVNFFVSYPEYNQSDFFITGESYAGVYVPMLIDQIDKRGAVTNFKGAAIGNSCWGSDCFYGIDENEIDFHLYAGHTMISRSLEDAIIDKCGDAFAQGGKPSFACEAELLKMRGETGSFYVYNIMDECDGDTLSMGDVRAALRANRTELLTEEDSFMSHPSLGDYRCGGDAAMKKWLADPAVIEALHVKKGTGGMLYTKTCGDLRELYKDLFQKHRILIYSGDADGCVPYYGSEQWTRELGFKLVTDWHPWKSETTAGKGSVVAGYATEYEHFTFVTVKGAGHMVPQFKPVRALTMFSKFLADEKF